jgi:DNA-binding CsgD family transcriptional regulator
MCSVLNRFVKALKLILRPGQYMRLDEDLTRGLKDLIANDVGRDPQGKISSDEVCAIAGEMIRFGMQYQWTSINNLRAWQDLTPRQRDIAVCVCLGYTNAEIASKLMISSSTVKTHIRNVLSKFDVGGKLELRGVLKDWDFSGWVFEHEMEDHCD